LENLERIHRLGEEEPEGSKVGIIGTKTNSSTGLFLWEIEKREKIEITDIPLKS